MSDKPITPNAKMWMACCGKGAIYLDHFLEKKLADVEWSVPLTTDANDSNGGIHDGSKSHYPQSINKLHQIKRFVNLIAVGDYIVTYDDTQRLYHIGVIRSEAQRIPSNAYGIEEWPGYSRNVDWKYEISRDSLSPDTRNKLGSVPMTVFGVNASAVQELIQRCCGDGTYERFDEELSKQDTEDILDTGEILNDYIAKSDDFIEDAIVKLDPFQLQDLVAGILRAMGYRTKVSPPGPDGGVDIKASPDGLDLSDPRIFVQVKHTKATIGAPAVHSFLGGRSNNDRCLYVSTGGFSKDAKSAGMHTPIPLTLIGMPELRELLTSHYENLDPETRALVPLKKVYWPIAE